MHQGNLLVFPLKEKRISLLFLEDKKRPEVLVGVYYKTFLKLKSDFFKQSLLVKSALNGLSKRKPLFESEKEKA